MMAWKDITLDVVVENDQTRIKYWMRIEEWYHRHIGHLSNDMLKYLTNRWGMILESCSRWAGCLEQVRHAPRSGATIDDYVSTIAKVLHIP